MGGDMLSIGEVAHSTGVSRRQLRHWEDVGLLAPDSIDASTGYRRYAPSRLGRVRAIASLRALGFGLDSIADLLDSQLDEPRLVGLLQERESDLVAEIAAASTRLGEVRTRLLAFEKGTRQIMYAHEIGPLPPLRLAALQATVRDESEIGDAVAGLLPRLHESRPDPEGVELVLTYDGTSDEAIVVTAGWAGSPGRDAGLAEVVVDGVDLGVTVTFDSPPANVGDAWIALDAQLAERGRHTTGIHRQIRRPDGRIQLQAPVRQAR